jgi:hypothetical protein
MHHFLKIHRSSPLLITLNRSRISHTFALGCTLWLGAMVLATMSCAAQETSDPGSVNYTVRGVVLNSVTHQPVARALVDAHENAVLTDNEGRFEFGLQGGTTEITVRRPGYGSRGRPSNHTIRAGPSMPTLTFYLTPEALITGQATLSTSDSADGIRVMAYRRRIVNGREQWTMEGQARTNSEGAFRLSGLQPGTYLLYTQPSRDDEGGSSRRSGVYGYPGAYYPGVPDVSAAGLLTLTAGQRAEADFTLTRQAFYSVTVAIADREGGGGINLQVRDASGRPVGFPVRWNAQQGTAETNLPSGRYFLEGQRRGESQLYGRVDFAVAGAPVSGLSMALLPLHGIPVTVRKVFTATSNAGGNGFSEGQQSGDAAGSAGLNISLVSAEEFSGQPGGGGLRAAGANEGSSYELDNLSPGRYWVETSPYEGYVSSITSGGVDLARDPLVIGPGASTAPIEVTLRDDTGTITAQLSTSSSGEPLTTASVGEQQQIYVYAIPLFPFSGAIRMSGIQGSGQLTLQGLAPGSYRVVAFDAPQEIDFHSPEGLAKYAGMGQTISVDAGGSANVQLDVIHTVSTDNQ